MSQARPWSGTRLKIESLIFPLQLMPRASQTAVSGRYATVSESSKMEKTEGYTRPPARAHTQTLEMGTGVRPDLST